MKKFLNHIFSIKTTEDLIIVKFLGIKISHKINNFYKQKYQDMLITLRYFAKRVKIDKELVSRIKHNAEFSPNKTSYQKDKNELQAYYDKVIDAEKLEPASGLIRQHQLRMLEVIKEIVPPLEKLNIRCCMSGGTLIGAVRHGGFIPWDDDADFDLPRDDYDRFVDYVKKEYIFLDTRDCRSFSDFWISMNDALHKNPNKIIFTDLNGYLQAYKGTAVNSHVTIDFFPWEYIADDVSMKKFDKWRKKMSKIYGRKCLTWGKLDDIYRKEINSNKIFSKSGNKLYFGGSYGVSLKNNLGFLSRDVFSPLQKIKFEDIFLPAPADVNKYLSFEYENYRKIPTNIDCFKFIKSISQTSKDLAKEGFYVDYDKLCDEQLAKV